MKTIEGVFVPVSGYEENYLQSLDENGESVSATSMLGDVHTVDSSEVSAFEGNRYMLGIIDEYRAHNPTPYPPAYRIKITVEVEPLSDAETEAAWLAHIERQRLPEHEEGT